MAQRRQQDLLSKLANRGEQMVGRITDLPGAKQLVDRIGALGTRLDDVQRRLRSLDPLERRVTQLERRLEKLESKGRTTTRRTAARPAAAKRSPSKGGTTSGRTTSRRRSSGSS